jgi:predicted anti-sigma-YlaC factor YlaD
MSETAIGMDCNELVEVITDYLEGTMPRQDVARFEGHLGECAGCTTYLEQMRLTINALGHLPPESLSAETEEHLRRAFRDWTYGR